MATSFSIIQPESFGFQLAYVRDVLAGITQSKLAEQVNQVIQVDVSSNHVEYTRNHVKNWEDDLDLHQVSPRVLDAIVQVVCLRLNLDFVDREKLLVQLRQSLKYTRETGGNEMGADKSRSSFGDLLSQIRDEKLGITQTEFANLLDATYRELGARTVTFHDIYEIELGRIPPQQLLNAILAVVSNMTNVPANVLEKMMQRSKDIYRPHDVFENVDRKQLRTRALIILLGYDENKPPARGGMRNKLLPEEGSCVRSFQDVQNATGIIRTNLSAYFTGLLRTLPDPDKACKTLVDYLNSVGVASRDVQEFELIMRELHARPPPVKRR